jgi:ectoine hydroxylase-related dioxygenase (phytanoyl-CoA dioxygenase family)
MFNNISEIKPGFQKLEKEGFVIINNVLTKSEVEKINSIIQDHFNKNKEKVNQIFGIRQLLLELPLLKEVVINANVKKILSVAGEGLFLSKAIFFDKPAESNWYVTWHQDATINVKEKIETLGFSGWTKKGVVTSVRPPKNVLKKTITLRIHLDDTDEKNGGLKVIPRSHHKRLNDAEISGIIQNTLAHTCEVNSGGIHIMKPLLLHASSKCTNQKHRRVIHLEFNSLELPNGLEWSEKELI